VGNISDAEEDNDDSSIADFAMDVLKEILEEETADIIVIPNCYRWSLE